MEDVECQCNCLDTQVRVVHPLLISMSGVINTYIYGQFINAATLLEGKLANFLIGVSDAPKYDIIRTENGNAIDSFIPEILTRPMSFIPTFVFAKNISERSTLFYFYTKYSQINQIIFRVSLVFVN